MLLFSDYTYHQTELERLMSDYADYTWGVTELQLVSVSQEVEAEQEMGVAMETKPCHNCSFDISVCGNLTDEYKMVIIYH